MRNIYETTPAIRHSSAPLAVIAKQNHLSTNAPRELSKWLCYDDSTVYTHSPSHTIIAVLLLGLLTIKNSVVNSTKIAPNEMHTVTLSSTVTHG